MMFVVCPAVVGGAFVSLAVGSLEYGTFMAVFHAGWFVESLWTQTMVIHMIRTPKIPFLQSRASNALLAATACGIAFGTILPYTPIGETMGLGHLPLIFFGYLALTMVGYMVLVTVVKKMYIRRFGQLL
jgi:Mg2+-importing ATPase